MSGKAIIFIGKKTVYLATVSDGRNPTVQRLTQYPWAPGKLADVLLLIRKRFGPRVRIVLSDEFCYVLHLAIPQHTINQRAFIRQQIQDKIPDNLDTIPWDFKDMTVVGSEKGQLEKIVQVVAVVGPFYKELGEALKKARFSLEAMEAVSCSLSRLVQNEKPVCIASMMDAPLLAVVEKGVVMATLSPLDVTPRVVEDFLTFVKETYGIVPLTLYFSGVAKGTDLTQFEKEGRTLVVSTIHPMVGIAVKKDIKGKDEQTLNLSVVASNESQREHAFVEKPSQFSDSNTGSQDADVSGAPSHKAFMTKKNIVFVCIIFLCIVSIGALLFGNIQKKPPKTATPAVSAIAASPSATLIPTLVTGKQEEATEAAATEYTIAIYNGSIKEGAAGALRDVLEENGLRVTDIGNADRNSYEQTEIRYKAHVSDDVKRILDKLLKTLYDNIVEEESQQDQATDIFIIIGNL